MHSDTFGSVGRTGLSRGYEARVVVELLLVKFIVAVLLILDVFGTANARSNCHAAAECWRS